MATEDGETCLHICAISRSYEIVELLIKNGANVNSRTTHKNGLRMTPLSWHVHGSDYKIVKLLLNNGADVNADFDKSVDSDEKITVTDVARERVMHEGKNKAVQKTYDLLVEAGGLPYQELIKTHDEV